MVQILPSVERESFGSIVGRGLGQGLGQAFAQFPEKMQSKEQERKAIETYKRLTGEDISGFPADERKTFLSERLKAQSKQSQDFSKNEQEDYEANIIEQNFGKKAADLYRSASTGGKTKLLGHYIEMTQRGQSVQDFLNQNVPEENIDFVKETNEKQPGISIEQKEPTFKITDFDKGKTPAERSRSQENRYKINLPLYQKSQEKRQSLNTEKDLLNILEELSPQIKAIERLNINPKSGDLIVPAFSSPEAQRFVKTVNEFTRNAKDTYGSRVTNFDLSQFMKRLPTLGNTEEGRRQIIEQMKIINDLNTAYENSLHDVVDSYGGIRNIDWDQAERFAEKNSQKQINNLKSRFSKITNNLNKSYKKSVEQKKKIVPKGHVAVERDDGTMGYVKKEKLNDFLNDNPGNRVL